MRIIGIILVMLLAATLAACTIDSDSALFGPSTGQRPFPSQSFILAPKEVYALRGNGGGYDFRESETYKNVTFVPLGVDAPDFYIAQVKKIEGGYSYALVDVDANGARRWPVDGKTYAEQLGIAFTEVSPGIKLDSRDDLLAILRAAYAARKPETAITFKVFDAADERQRAAGMAYLQELADAEAAAKGKPTTASVATAEVSNWVYREEIDPIDDSRKQYLFGKPTQTTGAPVEPYIRIGCYADGMGITLYWGSVMADQYPDGDADFVNVSVRFDAGDVYQLGWAASADWTTTYPPGELNGALTQLGNGLLNGLLPGLVGSVNSVWDAKQFHFSLMASKQLVLRASSRGAGAVTLVFDLAGYAAAAQNFRSSCL